MLRVGSAAAIDEVVHHPRGVVAGDVFPVIFKVVRIAGHGDLDVVGRQEPIEARRTFPRIRRHPGLRPSAECRGRLRNVDGR